MSLRTRSLSLYRRLLRMSRTWQGKDDLSPEALETEKAFIRGETRRMFKLHIDEKDPVVIEKLLKAADDRMALALHYKIAYPRPQHLVTGPNMDLADTPEFDSESD